MKLTVVWPDIGYLVDTATIRIFCGQLNRNSIHIYRSLSECIFQLLAAVFIVRGCFQKLAWFMKTSKNRLLPKNAESLLFIHYNLPIHILNIDLKCSLNEE